MNRQCDGCRFCCWSFNAHDVPDPTLGIMLKPAREHCVFECRKGCELHGKKKQPQTCTDFKCPYLQGKYIRRPDTFQDVLEEMGIGVGNFIPAIPPYVPIPIAEDLIRENRSIPAYILIGMEWIRVILSLDREDSRSWVVNENSVELWQNLFRNFGAPIDTTIEPGTVMFA